MTIAVNGQQPASLTAWHNQDGTLTVTLPNPQIILSREEATRLGEYLLKESN